LILGLAACAPAPGGDAGGSAATVTGGDFVLTITADKSVYQADEVIACEARLKYTGTEETTVYSSSPLVAFGIEGGLFDGGFAREDMLMRTAFAPGEEQTLPFQKSGGWSADDPNADYYEAFYADSALVLPPGEYTLSAVMEYATDENDVVGTQQTLIASLNITVEE
jgi:hypothetical protein